MDDLVKEFLVESYENLDQLDRDFVALEQDPSARDQISSIFRTIHTIKGTCGFLGLHKLESVTHVGENLLSKLRDGVFQFNSEMANALLAMVDAVREILAAIESTGTEGNGDYTRVIATLTALNEAKAAAAAPTVATATATATATAARPPAEPQHTGAPADVSGCPDALAALRAVEDEIARATDAIDPPVQPDLGAMIQDATEEPQPAAAKPPSADAAAFAFATAAAAAAEPAIPAASAPSEPAAAAEHGPAGDAAGSASNSSIRVDVNLLDKLMNLVGELVLARNQVLQFTTTQEDATFLGTSQRLNLITTELQEGVMKTRMQPIGTIWNKFPRVVRDLAKLCGKKVRIEMEGRETDLDKTIIEAIKDPLTHIIRNSVDHGVESPEKRKARGKPEEGCIYMRAFHEGGQVNIEIRDDGGGIDCERVKAKAVQKGVITADQAARMGEREAMNLIFAPGFSTAEKITNVSGRGVGMDVVKTNIEKIGGAVDVQSKLGEGTTLRIKIPLTLAIIPALVITSGGDRFAIPQVSLLELVRLSGEHARKGIEQIHGAPVYRLRGHLLPLVYLDEELRAAAPAPAEAPKAGQPAAAPAPAEAPKAGQPAAAAAAAPATASAAAAGDAAIDRDSVNIVVLQADGRQFGLVVDEINDTEEIVVKPLGKQLKGLTAFAGATIMGDGRVALILDVMGIAERASVVSEAAKDKRVSDGSSAARDDAVDRQTLLVVRVGQSRRMAVPLTAVARLEEFPRSQVETDGQGEVVQYRGIIMPLVRLSQVLTDRGRRAPVEDAATAAAAPASTSASASAASASASASGSADTLQVVVHTGADGRSVGLVVDRILDIIQEVLAVQRTASRPGVLGSAVLQEKVTELIDVEGVTQLALSGAQTVVAA